MRRQTSFVPRSVIAEAVGEERGREPDAARLRARHVGVDAHARAPGDFGGFVRIPARRSQLLADRKQIVLCQRFGTRHQFDVRGPEARLVGGGLRQFGRAPCKIVARNGSLPKRIPEPIAQPRAHFGDALVGDAAVRTRVAAVFHEHDLGALRSEAVVVLAIDRPVETIAGFGVRHLWLSLVKRHVGIAERSAPRKKA